MKVSIMSLGILMALSLKAELAATKQCQKEAETMGRVIFRLNHKLGRSEVVSSKSSLIAVRHAEEKPAVEVYDVYLTHGKVTSTAYQIEVSTDEC